MSIKEVNAVDPDSSFILLCEATDDVATTRAGARVEHQRELFDGGLFVNGGFEDGLVGWQQAYAWTATVDAFTAENPATSTNELLFQNFTLEEGAIYEISANNVSGDATINYVVNDADSGVAIGTPHTFVGIATAVSMGIFITDVGTVKSVVDSLRLVKIADANVVTYNGEIVTYNGETVTYNP